MPTANDFRNEQRTLFGDLDASNFADAELDTWRNEELGTLWSLGLFKRGTNRGSEPTVRADENGIITRYYTMPTNFRRVNEVEFIDAGHVAPPVLTLTTTTTGGTLASGLYVYRITVTDSNGETYPGPRTAIYVPTGTATNKVTLTWPTVTNAAVSYARTTGYKIYGRTSASILLMSTITSNTTATFTDDGSVTPAGALPTTDTSAKIADDVLRRASTFDDLEDTGSIRVEEATGYENFKVRMFGELEYTDITDTALRQEVLDVLLYGSVLRGLTAQYIKRINATRSLVSTKETDVSAGALSIGIQTMRNIYKSKIAKALAVQARSTLAR